METGGDYRESKVKELEKLKGVIRHDSAGDQTEGC